MQLVKKSPIVTSSNWLLCHQKNPRMSLVEDEQASVIVNAAACITEHQHIVKDLRLAALVRAKLSTVHKVKEGYNDRVYVTLSELRDIDTGKRDET